MRLFASRQLAFCILVAACGASGCATPSRGLVLSIDAPMTVQGIGACQGVEVRDDRVYFYGDAETGVIREYARQGGELRATGRTLALTKDGRDLIPHPTGLTHHPRYGTFIGNTVAGRGTIFHIDWDRLLADGNLDHAVLNAADDDLASNGTRPEFVRVDGSWRIATADYGDKANAVRLYDPKRLASASHTSEAGVLVRSLPCDPWVQNLHWVDDCKSLVLVQNQIAGRRWRLSLFDLANRAAPCVCDRFPRHEDELEGFHLLGDDRCVFVTSSRQDNVWLGRRATAKRATAQSAHKSSVSLTLR